MSAPINPYEPPVLASLADAPAGPADEVLFEGALSIAEVYAAARLAATGATLLSRVLLTFAGLATLYVVWLCYYIWSEQDYAHAPIALLGVGAAGCGLLIAFGKRFVEWIQVNKMKRQGLGAFAPTRGLVAVSHIESRGQASATRLDWSGFCGWRANEQVAVLFFSYPGPYLIFGRSKFASDADWQRLLAIIASKLPQV